MKKSQRTGRFTLPYKLHHYYKKYINEFTITEPPPPLCRSDGFS